MSIGDDSITHSEMLSMFDTIKLCLLSKSQYVLQYSSSTEMVEELSRLTSNMIMIMITIRGQALEMRCFRKLLGISYRDQITNEEVKARIGSAIGPYEDFLTSAKRRKLKWNGHVTRSSGLAKTILQGTVQGGRRRARQRNDGKTTSKS